jgi:hypothetical protein
MEFNINEKTTNSIILHMPDNGGKNDSAMEQYLSNLKTSGKTILQLRYVLFRLDKKLW